MTIPAASMFWPFVQMKSENLAAAAANSWQFRKGSQGQHENLWRTWAREDCPTIHVSSGTQGKANNWMKWCAQFAMHEREDAAVVKMQAGSMSLIYLAHLRAEDPANGSYERGREMAALLVFVWPLHLRIDTFLTLGKRHSTINQIKPISRSRFPYMPTIISVPRHPSNFAWVPFARKQIQITDENGIGNGLHLKMLHSACMRSLGKFFGHFN